MNLPIYVVDAFAERAFTGNPAGVCLLQQWPDESWMQSVAAEMRHAETAFLVPNGDGYGLRWFTPSVEVDLCGHATLASAHVLLGLDLAVETLNFSTRSGVLTASRSDGKIELDFPAEPPVPADLPSDLEFLGPIVWSGKNRMDTFVQLGSSVQVRELQPDFAAIAALGLRGLIVTAEDETGEFDIVSRGFFPQSGVDEDPVTGSAHCAFAAFWTPRLRKAVLRGYQASARGGVVEMELCDDRVKLRGNAITVLEGTLHC